MTPIYLPLGTDKGPSIFFYEDQYATVQGTWIIERDTIAFPLNVTAYKC
jgi:hypothetical protein